MALDPSIDSLPEAVIDSKQLVEGASSSAMFLPLVVVLLEAAAAKAVNPVALLLKEGAIFVLVGSVARPRRYYNNKVVRKCCWRCVVGGVIDTR
jgi:hypothetical protein